MNFHRFKDMAPTGEGENRCVEIKGVRTNRLYLTSPVCPLEWLCSCDEPSERYTDMIRTRTLMMAAAAALVGLSSCNDSSSGNSSEATNGVQPISTTDFASGTKYYSGTIGGKSCSVQVSAASGATKSAQINDVPAGLVIEGAAVPFECRASYRLEPDEQNATLQLCGDDGQRAARLIPLPRVLGNRQG